MKHVKLLEETTVMYKIYLAQLRMIYCLNVSYTLAQLLTEAAQIWLFSIKIYCSLMKDLTKLVCLQLSYLIRSIFVAKRFYFFFALKLLSAT